MHNVEREADADNDYEYMLRQFSILNLPAVRAFYASYDNEALNQFVLTHSHRYLDYDFIDANNNSLFIFTKSDTTHAATALPPLSSCPGAEEFPDFLADLQTLVSSQLGSMKKLERVAYHDYQNADAPASSSGCYCLAGFSP